MRTVFGNDTRRFLAWAVATLVAAYIAGKISDKIFQVAK